LPDKSASYSNSFANIYGLDIVAGAIAKASAARALGADYVANIVRQKQSPRRPQPPVPLRDPMLRDR
jgi:hypothetical protein